MPTDIVSAALTLTIQDASQSSGVGANIVNRVVPGMTFNSLLSGGSNFYLTIAGLTAVSLVPSALGAVGVQAAVFYVRNLGPSIIDLTFYLGGVGPTTKVMGVNGVVLMFEPTQTPSAGNYITNVTANAGNQPAVIEYLWAQ